MTTLEEPRVYTLCYEFKDDPGNEIQTEYCDGLEALRHYSQLMYRDDVYYACVIGPDGHPIH